tara:strand:+ start:452 stop:1174 length:723 start_codon:yes stop_codon:yes gene_type:complete
MRQNRSNIPTKDNLPSLYISPWRNIKKDASNLFSHMYLKTIEFFRLAREGNLQVPRYIPERISSLFWPFFFLFCLLLSLFISFYISPRVAIEVKFSFHNKDSIPNDSELAIDQRVVNNTNIDYDVNQQFKKMSGKNPINFSNSPESISLVTNDQELKKLYMQGYIQLDTLTLNNGVLIKVSDKWFQLSKDKRENLSDQLLKVIDEAGYQDVKIIDVNGYLVARKSFIGEGMILLGQYKNS